MMNPKIRLTITPGAVAALLVSYALILAAFAALVKIQQDQHKTAGANRRAIVYICSTTTVLDRLVSANIAQVKRNFQDGTYARLEAKGVLTQGNVDAARATLLQFEQAHVRLVRNSACTDVGK